MATVPVPIDAREATRLGYRSAQHAQRILDHRLRELEARERERERLDLFNEDDIISEHMSKMMILCGVSLREQELRDAIQDHLTLMAFHVAQGHAVSYEETYRAVNQIAEEHGFLSGVPIPVLGKNPPDLVMAPGVPLAEIFHMNQEHRRYVEHMRTETAQELNRASIPVRNSWHMLGDQTVCIVETERGPMAWQRWDAGLRLRKMMNGMAVRHDAHQRAEAELKAMESLRSRISQSQYDSYVLSGIFPEHSERSDIHYFFRKGLPTIAVSFHGTYKETGKVLAALCLHPMGFYAGTHVGLMTPTDEVIAHLLMMRSDEHAFWKKSGQWCATDTRSGI